MQNERQMHQEDIQARLAIAGLKNQSEERNVNANAATGMVTQGTQERQKSRELLVKIADQRAKERLERQRMAFEERMKEREFTLKRQEMQEKLKFQREQHKLKLQQNQQMHSQKLQMQKQAAKAKPAAAKSSTTARK
jgi:hypothetical protein